jgi:hypothetical protein
MRGESSFDRVVSHRGVRERERLVKKNIYIYINKIKKKLKREMYSIFNIEKNKNKNKY